MDADLACAPAAAATDMALPDPCHECIGRTAGLCHDIGVGDVHALNGIARHRSVAKGTVIGWAGDPNGHCANVISGVLKLSAMTADGREQAVGLLVAGDFLGEPFASANRLSSVALTDVKLCLYPREAFEQLLRTHPAIEHALLQRTLKSLSDARERQLLLARKSARERVASFLLAMKRHERVIDLPIARGEIADYLGLTIETVSRQFSALKEAGVIDFDKGARAVSLIDAAALQAFAGD